MAKLVDEYVAENRRTLRRIDARATEVDSRQTRTLNFSESVVTIDVTAELYKRSTGSGLLFGHTDDAHGFGRGTFGDDRGAWSLLTDAEASAEFTKRGRKAIAEALDGQTGAIERGVVGGSTTGATTDDTGMGAKTGESPAFTLKDSGNVTRGRFIIDAADNVGDPGEFGLIDGDGRLLARVTVDTSAFTVATDDEVRVDVILTFTGDGIGESVITDGGETALADSLASPKASVGPTKMEFGTGSTEFSKSDTALTNEVFEKSCTREIGRDRVTASTHVYRIDTQTTPDLADPHSYDLTEMSIVDNTGRMIWATTFRAVTKDETIGLDAQSTIIAV